MGLAVRLNAILALAVLMPSTARAEIRPANDGMFLCISPAVAARFWGDILSAARTGVRVTRTQAAQIAAKHDCRFRRSDSLRPINYVAGALQVSDGAGSGWTSPEPYIIYINQPAPK
jgi:hypothetical protein